MLAPLRRLRLAVWRLALQARLRRHGVRLRMTVGQGVRVAGRPAVDIDVHGARRAGTLAVSVGDRVRVGRGCVIEILPGSTTRSSWVMGSRCKTTVRFVLRGGTIRLAEHVHLRDGCELKAAGELTVGARTLCTRGATIHCDERVAIGALVVLGARVMVIDSDHTHDGSGGEYMAHRCARPGRDRGQRRRRYRRRGAARRAPGPNSVVAAGAAVRAGEQSRGMAAGGIPAKVLRPFDANR